MLIGAIKFTKLLVILSVFILSVIMLIVAIKPKMPVVIPSVILLNAIILTVISLIVTTKPIMLFIMLSVVMHSLVYADCYY